MAGASVEYYSRLERGALAGVSASVLDAIARAKQPDDPTGLNAATAEENPMHITPSTTEGAAATIKGPAEWFTGDVYIDPVAASSSPSRVQANLVHFMPGARTAWHRHPLGQSLFVTEGIGCVSAAADPSRSSAPATVCTSSLTRSTGTAPPPAG